MSSVAWGKHLWYSIHFIAIAYPQNPTDEEKQAYRDFYEKLYLVIPCKRCSMNYLRHLEELPIDGFLQNNKTLFDWTVKIHNIVNVETGKPQWSTEDAYLHYIEYLQYGSNVTNNDVTNGEKEFKSFTNQLLWYFSVILLFVTILAFLTVLRKNRWRRF